jgi:hypothetical protein
MRQKAEGFHQRDSEITLDQRYIIGNLALTAPRHLIEFPHRALPEGVMAG